MPNLSSSVKKAEKICLKKFKNLFKIQIRLPLLGIQRYCRFFLMSKTEKNDLLHSIHIAIAL